MSTYSCQAILFDLDGVLVDSTPCVTRIWSAWARQHGLDPESVVHAAHGQRTIDTLREVAPHLDAQRETVRIEQMELDDVKGLRALPGGAEMLASLPARRYTIVTSGTRALASKRLRTVGLPVPEKMVTADDVSHGKPDPEPYLAGARALGFEPQVCLVFEDAPSGIYAAKASGMQAIALLTTYAASELGKADAVIASLKQVRLSIESSALMLMLVGR